MNELGRCLRSLVKKVSNKSSLIKIVRFLGLRNITKRLYLRIMISRGSILTLKYKAIEAHFYADNYERYLILDQILAQGETEETLLLDALFNKVQSGDVVWDVGANIGVHSVFLAKKVGPEGMVVAFEPEPTSFEALKRNIELNKLSNITPISIALGDSVNQGILTHNDSIGKVSASLARNGKKSSGQQVLIMPGDILRDQKGLPWPKAIKIDVEGYERPVLEGLRNSLSSEKCSCLCCEVHEKLWPAGTTREDILELIEELGFKHTKIIVRGSELHVLCYKE